MRIHRKQSYRWWAFGAFLAVFTLLVVATSWYAWQLQPVSDSGEEKHFVVSPGETSGIISQNLQTEGLIRSEFAFRLYVRLHHLKDTLQAGTYTLSPNQSTQEIIKAITSGSVEQFSVTFLPGGTLSEHTKALRSVGYTEDEISKAYQSVSGHPLLVSRPTGADLEGYIYGETYTFGRGTTADQVVKKTLDTYYEILTDNQLITKFTQRSLTVHGAITLASIVQREVTNRTPSTVTLDQQTVAQVFYSRLRNKDMLGSDVTYQYIADKTGQQRSPNLDSPYNTRRYTGLPPGPIASPGLGALIAVANPAQTDYYFFLSGDDDKTYFARTNEEHERNIRDHCQEKCKIL